MDGATVFQMRHEYQLYKLANFKTNLRNLRAAIASGKGAPKPTPWGKSEAKQLLRDDIIRGIVKLEMDGDAVFQMRPEYQLYKLVNFKTNLKNLREAIDKDYKRMQKDYEWYKHDRVLLKELRKNDPPQVHWRQSEARKLLKQDIDDGLHKMMKPSKLWESRQEYLAFAPDVFRKHIHQEVDDVG